MGASIPSRSPPGRVDAKVMQQVITLLPKANVHVFLGGRRSFEPLGSDPKHPIRGGLGYIVANAPNPKPIIIPVYIGGVEKNLWWQTWRG